ncbi:Tbingi protein [Diplonema papillatum]|nr:Tbingi protein [Diplonema papillatum]
MMPRKHLWPDTFGWPSTLNRRYAELTVKSGTHKQPRERLTFNPFAPWLPRPAVDINPFLPEGKKRSPAEKKRIVEQYLLKLPVPDCTVWTDGSVLREQPPAPPPGSRIERIMQPWTTQYADTRTWGGAAALIECAPTITIANGHDYSIRQLGNLRSTHLAHTAGRFPSSLKAETLALAAAMRALLEILAPTPESRRILILSDSQSLLRLLAGGPQVQKQPLLVYIWSALSAISQKGYTTTLQFVYGHCGLRGNEVTDSLAKRAAFHHFREVTRGNAPGEPPLAAEDAVTRYKAFTTLASTEPMARAAFIRAERHRVSMPYARIVDGRSVKRPCHLTVRAEREIRQIRTGHHPLVMTMYAADYADLDMLERRRAYRSCAFCKSYHPNVLEHMFIGCVEASSQAHRMSLWAKAARGKGPDPAARLPSGATNADKLWHVLFKHPEMALEYLQDTGLIPRFAVVKSGHGESLPTSDCICDGRSVWSSQTVTSQISALVSVAASSQPEGFSREPVDSEASEVVSGHVDETLPGDRPDTPDLESVAAGGLSFADALPSDDSASDWA